MLDHALPRNGAEWVVSAILRGLAGVQDAADADQNATLLLSQRDPLRVEKCQGGRFDWGEEAVKHRALVLAVLDPARLEGDQLIGLFLTLGLIINPVLRGNPLACVASHPAERDARRRELRES